MGKVQVGQRFSRTGSDSNLRSAVKQKVHCIDQEGKDVLPSSSENITEPSDEKIGRNYNKPHLNTHFSVAVHLVALAALSYMIALDTANFIKHPTGTSALNEMYEVEKIDFPGVAICNLNVMSREAVMLVVDKIWSQKQVKAIGNLTHEKIQRLLKYLGHLILFEDDEDVPGDIMLCQEILELSLNTTNVVKYMEDISPKCGSFMENCYWQGSNRKCHELFVQRWTQDGYCCTFNYVRWSDSISSQQDTDFKVPVLRAKIMGQQFGLRVHLRPELNDQFYNILPGNGFKILIYKASDYPDAPSGGSREILVTPGTDNYLTLRATSFYTSPDVIRYDKNKRNCLFKTELYEIYNGFYSYSQCMMLCRIHDIYKICGCVPFFYPIPSDIGDVRRCKLVDVKCLKRNRYKWWSVKPENADLDQNAYDSINEGYIKENLDCDCLPTCENIYYSVAKTDMKINNYDPNHLTEKKSNLTKDDVIITVNFQSASAQHLRQDAMFHWYDLLSNYGGLCSLFIGMSIITPLEIFYLFCSRFWSRWRKNRRTQNKISEDVSTEIHMRQRTIYWMELVPPERFLCTSER